jgi:hypothetical protein
LAVKMFCFERGSSYVSFEQLDDGSDLVDTRLTELKAK